MPEPASFLDRADAYVDLSLRGAGVVAVLLIALAVNAALRVAIRHLTRRAVRRALVGRGRWMTRHPRIHDGPSSELRRRQRADAAAHMVARLAGLAVLTVAVVVSSALIRVDPVVVLSSAGFLGAAVSIGGQSVIRDWLTGLVVLLEDRYAVGDRVTLRVAGEDQDGIIEALTGVGLRLRRADGSTWHTGHGSVDYATNHSQRLVDNDIEIPAEVWEELGRDAVGRTVNEASHDLGLTGVVLASDVEAHGHSDATTRVTVQASRTLNRRQRELLAARITGGEPPPAGPQETDRNR